MFFNSYPLFNRGRTLKLEMLEQLRDFPRNFIDVLLEQYSNGILSGCQLKVNNDYITVSKGIVKHNGMIYILKENCIVPYERTNNLVILKIRFLDETKNNDFIRYGTELFIDDNLEIENDEIELCRFKVKTGAKLRVDYVDFQDMSTEYDTINIINSPYAAKGKSSLSPEILKCFAKEAFKYNLSNPLDISFCMMCLQNQDVMELDLLLSYIGARLKIQLKEYSNKKIYECLVRILENIKQGKEALGNNNKGNYRKILVD